MHKDAPNKDKEQWLQELAEVNIRIKMEKKSHLKGHIRDFRDKEFRELIPERWFILKWITHHIQYIKTNVDIYV